MEQVGRFNHLLEIMHVNDWKISCGKSLQYRYVLYINWQMFFNLNTSWSMHLRKCTETPCHVNYHEMDFFTVLI